MVYEIFDEPRVSKIIRAGHIQNMDDTRIPKRVYEKRTKGRKPVEKPHKRWLDSVHENSALLFGFRNWKMELVDLDVWRKDIGDDDEWLF